MTLVTSSEICQRRDAFRLLRNDFRAVSGTRRSFPRAFPRDRGLRRHWRQSHRAWTLNLEMTDFV